LSDAEFVKSLVKILRLIDDSEARFLVALLDVYPRPLTKKELRIILRKSPRTVDHLIHTLRRKGLIENVGTWEAYYYTTLLQGRDSLLLQNYPPREERMR
jgi:hypothetical protein